MKDIIAEILDDILEQECVLHMPWSRAVFFKNQSVAKRIELNQIMIWDKVGFAIPKSDWPRFLATLANHLKDQRQEEALIN
jgi:hypothetical protein